MLFSVSLNAVGFNEGIMFLKKEQISWGKNTKQAKYICDARLKKVINKLIMWAKVNDQNTDQ